jgi:hypothetical protein
MKRLYPKMKWGLEVRNSTWFDLSGCRRIRSISTSSLSGDTDWTGDWFEAYRRRWCNAVNVELTHALEGNMPQVFVILKSCILRYLDPSARRSVDIRC